MWKSMTHCRRAALTRQRFLGDESSSWRTAFDHWKRFLCIDTCLLPCRWADERLACTGHLMPPRYLGSWSYRLVQWLPFSAWGCILVGYSWKWPCIWFSLHWQCRPRPSLSATTTSKRFWRSAAEDLFHSLMEQCSTNNTAYPFFEGTAHSLQFSLWLLAVSCRLRWFYRWGAVSRKPKNTCIFWYT